MVTPTRNFNLCYILLDSAFLLALLLLLLWKKEYRTFVFAIFGGILYFAVDFGIFYAALGSRQIQIGGVVQGPFMTAMVLLWMSLSYGITNFAFIWLCLKKDKWLWQWLGLIVGWWLLAPFIARLGGEMDIQTYRTTGEYHHVMAILMAVGYAALLLYNLFTKKKRIAIWYLCLVGIAVQLGWEGALLLGGIRPWNENSLLTLIVDSLIETNLGLPYIFLIYAFVSHKWGKEPHADETLPRVNLSFEESLEAEGK